MCLLYCLFRHFRLISLSILEKMKSVLFPVLIRKYIQYKPFEMKNQTECLVVMRSYTEYYDERNTPTVYVKEFLFKDTSCKRYCIYFEKNRPYISHVTEHKPYFFDRVAEAYSGKPLYELYHSEGIDVVPMPKYNMPYRHKYQYLNDFCVVYNVYCNECSLIYAINNNIGTITYNSHCIPVYIPRAPCPSISNSLCSSSSSPDFCYYYSSDEDFMVYE